ncbi:MAG: hypothetical protein ACO3EE_06025 [Flavobacteriales bacterium]
METKEKKSIKLLIILVGALVLLGSIVANIMFFNKSNHYKGESENALVKIDSLNTSIGESKKEFEALTKERDRYSSENKKLNSSIENLKNEINLIESVSFPISWPFKS